VLSGIKFISTSSDFYVPPVTVEAVKLLRSNLGKELGIKAVGGIRDTQTALQLLEAGAIRLGMSAVA